MVLLLQTQLPQITLFPLHLAVISPLHLAVFPLHLAVISPLHLAVFRLYLAVLFPLHLAVFRLYLAMLFLRRPPYEHIEVGQDQLDRVGA